MLRATFIIDPDGKIAQVFPKVSAEKARRTSVLAERSVDGAIGRQGLQRRAQA